MFFLWWNKNENYVGKALVKVCNVVLAFVHCRWKPLLHLSEIASLGGAE